MGPRHQLGAPINNPMAMQGMGMPNPMAMVPGAGGETMQPCVSGPPPQFIELRHNAQRMPLGPQFLARGAHPRPRHFVPHPPMAPQMVQQPMPQALDAQAESMRKGLQQGGLGLLLSQQGTDLPQQSQVKPQIPTATPSTPGAHQNPPQVVPPSGVGAQPTAPVDSVDLPEAVLEDPFAPKGLGDATGDAGVEDEDDLATLDLDPDKGDDDLGNLDNLETADPHLDDLLNSDEFDLLAYTDPELDQGDPKDVFSDQLRLVEAEGEGPTSSATADNKPEEKPKVGLVGTDAALPSSENVSTPKAENSSGSQSHSSAEGSDGSRLASIKLEDKGLTESLSDLQQQSNPTAVKDEMGEAVSMLLGGSTQTPKQPGGENSTASLSTVRLGGMAFPLSNQSDPLSFPPATPHPDLGEDPLGLPDGGGQHSPAVDLDKVESSLEASELPLLIQDLLEHEKKELQKQQQQQQLNALQQGAMGAPLHPQQPTPHGAGHVLLPTQRPQGLIGQPGMVPRPPHMMTPQQQQQQQQHRLIGAPMAPPQPHLGMPPQQGMMRVGQPGGIHPGLNPQQPAQPQQMVKPNLGNNFFPDKGSYLSLLFG